MSEVISTIQNFFREVRSHFNGRVCISLLVGLLFGSLVMGTAKAQASSLSD
jgi:hypothetical protein